MKNEEEKNNKQWLRDGEENLVNQMLEVFVRPFLEKELFEGQDSIERTLKHAENFKQNMHGIFVENSDIDSG